METMLIDGIWFKGQYAPAVKRLLEGQTITINNFNNGGWEPTVKLKRFIKLINYTKLEVVVSGDSLRTTTIRLK